jgi:hypothetical protein
VLHAALQRERILLVGGDLLLDRPGFAVVAVAAGLVKLLAKVVEEVLPT